MTVAVPSRANRRPWRPRRRIPIPFVTLVPADGSPVQFAIEDRSRVGACARKKLCQLCGNALDPIIVFVGGPTATQQLIFRQAPFHEECARYAIATCPYLRRTDDPQLATFCRRFEYVPTAFPLTVIGQTTVMKAFLARAIVRIESVGLWAA
jgi:hypothetical protein